MPNLHKQKGSRFEYSVKWALEMLSCEVIRAYSSAGTCDLIASPSWNPRGFSRTLLIQCKNTEKADYVVPFEFDKLEELQQRNSGMVLLIFNQDGKCMIKIWESGKIMTFDDFIGQYMGIPCSFTELIKNFRAYKRPLHLYQVPKEIYIKRDGTEGEKPVAPFADLYSVDFWFPHIPEREKHIIKA